MFRRIFGPKRDEVTGEWKKLHSEEIKDVFITHQFSGDKIAKNEMGVACSSYGREKRHIQSFGVKI